MKVLQELGVKGWLAIVVTLTITLSIGIKAAVILFLNTVPEDFFRLTEKVRTSRDTNLNLASSETKETTTYRWDSLPSIAPFPADNPTTPAKVKLGELLFFDKNLSKDRSLACESCHSLFNNSGADGAPISTGIYGQKGNRNAPTVWNTAFQRHLFWDGRASSLEQQALQPFLNPIEMGMDSADEIVQRVKEQPRYSAAFAKAFPGDTRITIDKIVKAIASYERTLITDDSLYDDYVRGDKDALSQQQLNGMSLFAKTGCTHCHFGPNFSAASIFNDGLGFRVFPATPNALVTKYNLDNDRPQVWRVPSLRNVALTGPWLHNGSVNDLHEVVRIMAKSQLAKSASRTFQWSDKKLGVIENPDLTEAEIDDIVAFLNALSSKKLLQRKPDITNSGQLNY